MNVVGVGPASQADLDGCVGASFGGAGRLEVDGGEDGLGDFDGIRTNWLI